MADFTHTNQHGIVMTTNKVASFLDLQIIEKYVKNINHINSDNVKIPCLP